MAVGLPFNIGLTGLPPAGVPGVPGTTNGAATQAAPYAQGQ
jgi:hypothetical protein